MADSAQTVPLADLHEKWMEDPAYRAEYEALQDGGGETIRLRDLRRLDVQPGRMVVAYANGDLLPTVIHDLIAAGIKDALGKDDLAVIQLGPGESLAVIRPAA